MAAGRKALNKNAMGKMMSLFRKEPFVMAQSTGSSREALKPTAFSAFTARSSPKIPAVFLVAIFDIEATSSISAAMSSRRAKNPEAIGKRLCSQS